MGLQYITNIRDNPRIQTNLCTILYQIENITITFGRKSQKEFYLAINIINKIPYIFILKKNKKLRFCTNYRKLNQIIIKNKYLLSNIREL